MKKMTFVLLTVIVGVIVLTPAFGWVKNEDINRDGVKEKVFCREKITYEQRDMLTITRQGKVIFMYKPSKIKGLEKFKIVDFDSRQPGKEIIVFIPSIPDPYSETVAMRYYISYQYVVIVYRWDTKAKEYLGYWTFYLNTEKYTPDQVSRVYEYVKSERPKFRAAEVRALEFVKAIGQGDWIHVMAMMETTKPWIKVSDYHGLRKDCQHFPSSKTWEMFASPHDRDNISFIARKSKTQAFTIIVTPQGVEMWRGDCWD